jgi:hypothetical protein
LFGRVFYGEPLHTSPENALRWRRERAKKGSATPGRAARRFTFRARVAMMDQ